MPYIPGGLENVFPSELGEFENLMEEVEWNVMRFVGLPIIFIARGRHRTSPTSGEVPRLVAVQGEIDSSILYTPPSPRSPGYQLLKPSLSCITYYESYPIYHHPAGESASVSLLAHRIRHPGTRRTHSQAPRKSRAHSALPHGRGLLYISDKMIDIVRGPHIVNVSLGARRTMTLRTKMDAIATTTGNEQLVAMVMVVLPCAAPARPRPTFEQLTFVIGLETNARWVHCLRMDKRPENIKDSAERGPRISLTFRHNGTFLTPILPSSSSPAGQAQAQVQQLIFGQGPPGKTHALARPVVHGAEEAERLLAAFGTENHQSELDWDMAYGKWPAWRGVRCAALFSQRSRVGVVRLLWVCHSGALL